LLLDRQLKAAGLPRRAAPRNFEMWDSSEGP
jgi:hypothetical protein